MLSADALAALEAATPPEQRIRPPSDVDVLSTVSAPDAVDSPRDPSHVDSPTTASTASPGGRRIGQVCSERAKGTDDRYDSAEKWILAALKTLERDVSDLLLQTHEPNDALVSQVHTLLAEWRTRKTSARDAGVVDRRPHELSKPPPECILANARGWFIRHVNRKRADHGVREVDDNWARKLAGVRADAREVNSDTRDGKARSGALYHHKHDLAPTYEEITTMCVIGFTGDVRVDASLLEACETGMAIAIYLPTGARGSELRNMHLQSIGYEDIPHERSGHSFECLKLTAFECKTKEYHLNQFLPASNPWRCGVGALGISVLVRVKLLGPPPFTMQRDERSWKIIGTSVGKSFDRRLNDAFEVAGVRRQTKDPLTYLGRHFGTRVLQHQGGSSEGGAARRGHTSGATFAYSECPLPDLLRLMGNHPDKPFVPAHLQRSLYASADMVLVILFPQLHERREYLVGRQREVDAMRGKSVRVRTDEQLNDQERMLNGLRLACRVALLCLVARPRAWQRWSIVTNAATQWQRAGTNRVVQFLFAGNEPAITAMNELAVRVRRCEESEIEARNLSPDEAATSAAVTAIQNLSERQAQREEELIRQQRSMFEILMRRVSPATTADAAVPSIPPPPPPATVAATLLNETPAPTSAPLASTREKRKPQEQHDVAHFSSWPTLRAAFEYARDDLAPRERAEGAAWRIRKVGEGSSKREDKSRDRQWRFYRQLAIAIGLRAHEVCDVDDALEALEMRRATFPSVTAFVRAMHEEQSTVRDGDEIAKRVLGC